MKKSNKLSKLNRRLLIALVALVGLSIIICKSFRSDSYIKDRVVRLDHGESCSGEQIIAPSGISYILTAAHCKSIAVDGNMHVILEDGSSIERKVIAEDDKSDLLLIEGVPNLKGLPVAPIRHLGEHVRTFTHGNRRATYMTEGEIIQDRGVEVPIFDINGDPAKLKECQMPKYKEYKEMGFFGEEDFCVLEVQETVTTAKVVPGSSGGIVVNDSGELVGVVSATDGTFGYLITLSDVNNFLAGY